MLLYSFCIFLFFANCISTQENKNTEIYSFFEILFSNFPGLRTIFFVVVVVVIVVVVVVVVDDYVVAVAVVV